MILEAVRLVLRQADPDYEGDDPCDCHRHRNERAVVYVEVETTAPIPKGECALVFDFGLCRERWEEIRALLGIEAEMPGGAGELTRA